MALVAKNAWPLWMLGGYNKNNNSRGWAMNVDENILANLGITRKGLGTLVIRWTVHEACFEADRAVLLD